MHGVWWTDDNEANKMNTRRRDCQQQQWAKDVVRYIYIFFFCHLIQNIIFISRTFLATCIRKCIQRMVLHKQTEIHKKLHIYSCAGRKIRAHAYKSTYHFVMSYTKYTQTHNVSHSVSIYFPFPPAYTVANGRQYNTYKMYMPQKMVHIINGAKHLSFHLEWVDNGYLN